MRRRRHSSGCSTNMTAPPARWQPWTARGPADRRISLYRARQLAVRGIHGATGSSERGGCARGRVRILRRDTPVGRPRRGGDLGLRRDNGGRRNRATSSRHESRDRGDQRADLDPRPRSGHRPAAVRRGGAIRARPTERSARRWWSSLFSPAGSPGPGHRPNGSDPPSMASGPRSTVVTSGSPQRPTTSTAPR